MSIQHSVDIEITAQFSYENVLQILRNGSELGFIYYDFIDGLDNFKITILSPDKACLNIINPKHDFKNEYGRILNVKNNDVWLHLFFEVKENNKLIISLANFSDEWKQDFFGSGTSFYTVKYQRFIKTGLAMCKNFCIQKIFTESY